MTDWRIWVLLIVLSLAGEAVAVYFFLQWLGGQL